jgi:hypothetical protein
MAGKETFDIGVPAGGVPRRGTFSGVSRQRVARLRPDFNATRIWFSMS